MRKVKVECRVPSWNYCNIDIATSDYRFSKELCKFCTKTKQGHHCLLLDKPLKSDDRFVYKTAACIDAAATGTAAEEPQIQVAPSLIIDETLRLYKKTMNDLLKQGYPRNIAETVATKYVKDGGK